MQGQAFSKTAIYTLRATLLLYIGTARLALALCRRAMLPFHRLTQVPHLAALSKAPVYSVRCLSCMIVEFTFSLLYILDHFLLALATALAFVVR